MRIRFCIPAARHPIGGVNVMLQMAHVLRAAGHDVTGVTGEKGYSYPYMDHDLGQLDADPALKPLRFYGPSLRKRAENALQRVHLHSHALPVSRFDEPGSVVVLPEFCYADLAPSFPSSRRVLLVQDVHGFARAFSTAKAGSLDPFERIISTSAASAACVGEAGGSDLRRVMLHVGRAGMQYTEQKKRQIAFMPRKRSEEAAFALALLQQAPETEGYDFVHLADMSERDLAAALSASLIFLSFSDREGFGLPPAEAMLCGCIVVGYDGVGGREYFELAGVEPVPDSDVVGLVKATRAALRSYRDHPETLDRQRRASSEAIAQTYTAAAFAETVLAAFAGLDR